VIDDLRVLNDALEIKFRILTREYILVTRKATAQSADLPHTPHPQYSSKFSDSTETGVKFRILTREHILGEVCKTHSLFEVCKTHSL